jgi:hypothetical protein
LIPEQFLPPLRIILEQLEDAEVEWAITGSLSMALQGMDLEIHDIDIQTDEDGAYEIERRLADFVAQPVLYKSSERMRSRLGRLEIEGVSVEVMGGIQKKLPDGSWEDPVQVGAHKRVIEAEGLSVPVLSLEYEYEAYKLMGREERAKEIRTWLDEHPAS